ncbi:MAG: GNAT family N-acetyltransferase [Geminicoccaceae bacterium]
MSGFQLRPATSEDADTIWRMLEGVIRAGETYAFDRDMSREAALHAWMKLPKGCWIAEDAQGRGLGTFYIKTNQAGGGDHVCNAGFITGEAARGRGLGRWMGKRALEEAERLGYRAMQFNFVLASNAGALKLWRSLGFVIVGTIPDAFRHPQAGLVDAHVMYRRLGSALETT